MSKTIVAVGVWFLVHFNFLLGSGSPMPTKIELEKRQFASNSLIKKIKNNTTQTTKTNDGQMITWQAFDCYGKTVHIMVGSEASMKSSKSVALEPQVVHVQQEIRRPKPQYYKTVSSFQNLLDSCNVSSQGSDDEKLLEVHYLLSELALQKKSSVSPSLIIKNDFISSNSLAKPLSPSKILQILPTIVGQKQISSQENSYVQSDFSLPVIQKKSDYAVADRKRRCRSNEQYYNPNARSLRMPRTKILDLAEEF